MQNLELFLESLMRLSPEELTVFLSVCSEVEYKKNTIIQPIGHTCKSIYFVDKGMLRIFYFKDETDVTESFETENAIVARAESLFDGKPSNKGIQAIENVRLIVIDAKRLYELFDEYPKIERAYRLINESLYVKTINRIESLQFQTAKERYRNLLSGAADIVKRAPLMYIASYLGITQVSLSRIRAEK